MTKYEPIDSMLSQWAVDNGVQWYTEYQDTEVRKFGLNMNRRDRVLVSVDVPEGDQTTIRIGQNQRGLSRLNRIEIIPSLVSEISTALDRALQIAKNWAIG
jgi:hypothetical protein